MYSFFKDSKIAIVNFRNSLILRKILYQTNFITIFYYFVLIRNIFSGILTKTVKADLIVYFYKNNLTAHLRG